MVKKNIATLVSDVDKGLGYWFKPKIVLQKFFLNTKEYSIRKVGYANFN